MWELGCGIAGGVPGLAFCQPPRCSAVALCVPRSPPAGRFLGSTRGPSSLLRHFLCPRTWSQPPVSRAAPPRFPHHAPGRLPGRRLVLSSAAGPAARARPLPPSGARGAPLGSRTCPSRGRRGSGARRRPPCSLPLVTALLRRVPRPPRPAPRPPGLPPVPRGRRPLLPRAFLPQVISRGIHVFLKKCSTA